MLCSIIKNIVEYIFATFLSKHEAADKKEDFIFFFYKGI
jgi:hypothetical protein